MRALLASFAIAVAIGCGGRSTTEPDAGTSGASGTGGGTTGGSGGVTVGGTGGSATGGTGGATVGGTGGAGGAGGFGGTGTGGSGSVPPDYRTCTGPGQCELTPTQCCSCGILGLNQLSAINSAKRAEFKRWSCGPAPEACPPCIGMADPYLGARCESAICGGFDIRSDPTFTKCSVDQDCMLRNGLGCCECNATSSWVAMSRVGAMVLTGQVCSPMSVCPGCVPTPPADLVAACRNGACVEMRIPISNIPY